jgi:hypothetical protein
VDMLAGAKWFSTFYPKSGYWQVDLHSDDREKTAMAVHGHVLWTLQRSSNVWAFNKDRLMRPHLRVISPVPGRRDRDWPHLPRASAIPAESVQRIRDARLKLKTEKCKLFKRKCGTSGMLCHLRR